MNEANSPPFPSGIDPTLLLEIYGQTPIVFHRIYVDITNDILAALWLSYAVFYVNEFPESVEDGWVARSQAHWQADTGLSRREQERARRRLRELGLITERRRPNAPMQYRVEFDRLFTCIERAAEVDPAREPGA